MLKNLLFITVAFFILGCDGNTPTNPGSLQTKRYSVGSGFNGHAGYNTEQTPERGEYYGVLSWEKQPDEESTLPVYYPDERPQVVAVPTPEPMTWVMGVMGLGALAFIARYCR